MNVKKTHNQDYSEYWLLFTWLLFTSSLNKLKSMESKLGNGGYVPVKIETS